MMGPGPCGQDLSGSDAGRNQPTRRPQGCHVRAPGLGQPRAIQGHLEPVMRKATDRRGHIASTFLVAINQLNLLQQ